VHPFSAFRVRNSAGIGGALLAAALVFGFVSQASADPARDSSGSYERHLLEAEAHVISAVRQPGGRPIQGGVGFGVRAVYSLIPNGIVAARDSIGVGLGVDAIVFGRDCAAAMPAASCVNERDLLLPFVVPWNFWLGPEWSVFIEPGARFEFRFGANQETTFDAFIFHAGGRFHFKNHFSWVLRAGWAAEPLALATGISWFL
jgi:hypothetical protein